MPNRFNRGTKQHQSDAGLKTPGTPITPQFAFARTPVRSQLLGSPRDSPTRHQPVTSQPACLPAMRPLAVASRPAALIVSSLIVLFAANPVQSSSTSSLMDLAWNDQPLAVLAFAVSALLLVVFLIFPGAIFRPRVRLQDARFWADLSLRFARAGVFARCSHVYDYLALDTVAADGEIRARVRLDAVLQDSSQQLHVGAAAFICDELSTASIMSQRCYPGVSISLSCTRVADCQPPAVIHVVTRILRQGRKLVHTEVRM